MGYDSSIGIARISRGELNPLRCHGIIAVCRRKMQSEKKLQFNRPIDDQFDIPVNRAISESLNSSNKVLPATSCNFIERRHIDKPNKQKLSILHTVEFYQPHIGGSEMVVQKISEKLAQRGHIVEVATSRFPERTFKQLNCVELQEFDMDRNATPAKRQDEIKRYEDFLLHHPADVVMNYAAQQWATDLAFPVVAKTREKRVNIIAPCGYSALLNARTVRWPQFEQYFKQVIPYAIPLYDAAVYHSASYKDYEFAQLHGFQNSVIIPNGVDEEEFSQTPKIDFRKKYGVKTKYMGLCVANYYSSKGQNRVLDAVQEMKRQDFTMVFIGKDGDALRSLQHQAGSLNVKFLVNIPRNETIAAFHVADLFLFGSYIEASPLVIIEAKASRTPFVSTDCGNVKEWKGGVVCPPEEMAEHSNKILDDKGLRKRLAEEGYKEWKEKLTWDVIVDQYEELYFRLHFEKMRGKKLASSPLTDESKYGEPCRDDFRNTSALIRLAEIELRRSNPKKAKNYLIAALALEPRNHRAKDLIEKIRA